jgi:hypothetical protein
MGVLDRVKSLFVKTGNDDDDEIVEAPVNVVARRAQLDELEKALRTLARAMAASEDRMANPGWRGRVEDLRFAADEAAQLSRSDITRAALHDVAAEVRTLYGPNRPVPAEYAPYQAEHDRVVAAAAALRAPLSTESGSG